MVKLVTVALCVTAAIAGAMAETPLEFGMDMSNRGLKAVCWYEHLKVFPNTESKTFGYCNGGADLLIQQVNEPDPTNKQYFDFYPEKKETFFGENIASYMDNIPSDYLDSCNQYAADPKAAPPANEGDALNDGGNDYPYKAFAYCLMSTLRSKHGDAAIEAVKKEKTHSMKPWMQTLLDRENEFRARHGVDPLRLNPDLIHAAQGWADKSAKNCQLVHASLDERKYNGEDTGESISEGFKDPADTAYQAADGWYEEVKNYPFPEGYTGNGLDAQFYTIGHFSQSVWKSTKYVGYGLKYNGKCGDGGTSYVVARYFPGGNLPGDFVNNVQPVQN